MRTGHKTLRLGLCGALLAALTLGATDAAGVVLPVTTALTISDAAGRIPTVSAVGTVRFRGTPEQGCWVFLVEDSATAPARAYELRGGGEDLYEDGVRARVFGVVRNDVETRCGLPILVVRYYRILTPAPAYGVMLLLDRPAYVPRVLSIGPGRIGDASIRLEPPVLHGLLGVVNHTHQPVVLGFSSSQRFDFRILDCSGRVVWQWSDGKAFLTVMGREQVGPRPLMYPVRVRLVDPATGRPLPPGTYTLEGWITHIPECRSAALDPRQAERPVDELAGAVRFKILPFRTPDGTAAGD